MTEEEKQPKESSESQQEKPPVNRSTTYDLRDVIDEVKKRIPQETDLPVHGGTTHDVTHQDIKGALAMSAEQRANLDNRSYFAPQMVLRLDSISGDANPITVEVSGESIVGRADNVSDYMPDIDLSPHGAYRMGLSRKHAIICREGTGLVVKDLGSRNGTFINGIQVASGGKQNLKDGDELRFGNLALRITFQKKS